MPITPDTKDWTWVIEKPCDECGFDAATFSERDVASLIRHNAAAWAPVLNRADVALRPDENTWSALEYGAHVRDVFRIFGVRLALMLEQDDPLYANWDQDATALEERYNEQDAAVVSAEILAAGNELASAFDSVTDSQWGRAGRRTDGASFTVATFAKYLAHDPTHHLWDVHGS
jgi:hypothetical protein